MYTQLLPRPLKKEDKIAFVCSRRLGDALIAMVTINNLVRRGYAVEVFGDYIYALRDWFPWVKVFPHVPYAETKIADNAYGKSRDTSYDTALLRKIFSPYSVVLHMYDDDSNRLAAYLSWHPCSVALSNSPLYKSRFSMVDIQTAICRTELGLFDISRENNIRPLSHLVAHRHLRRVIFHPTSFLTRKNWPKHKFILLAQKLMRLDYEVSFIVAQEERSEWRDVINSDIALPELASLSAVATFIYESGFFIGNDSGIGHLASNLGVPTVSIILRPGVARQWRPTWADGEVVLSPAWLNPRPVKEKLWKHFVTVGMVLKKFIALQSRNSDFKNAP